MLTYTDFYYFFTMPTIDLTLAVTELFAATALIINIIAYRQQSVKHYRVYSGIAMLLLAIHFFRLDAYAASIGCFLAVIRNIVSLKYNDWLTTAIFVGINILALAIEWFYLGSGAEIFIAYAASIIFTIGTLRLQNIISMRRWFTCAEGLSLLYAIVVGSIFGSIYSALNLVVLITFWVKHLSQKTKNSESNR